MYKHTCTSITVIHTIYPKAHMPNACEESTQMVKAPESARIISILIIMIVTNQNCKNPIPPKVFTL